MLLERRGTEHHRSAASLSCPPALAWRRSTSADSTRLTGSMGEHGHAELQYIVWKEVRGR